MGRSSELASSFREVMLNGDWVANTNFQKELNQVSWEEANKKVANLNTIGLLMQHVNYYVEGVLQVYKGGDLTIRDKYSFDFDPLASEEEWITKRDAFYKNAEEFAQEVEKMSDEKLDSSFVKEQYGSYQRNVLGMIEHCYYHLGQVSMLRKLIQNG